MLIAFNALTIEGNSPATAGLVAKSAVDPPMILTFGTPAPTIK
jgi:hypothetical protein